MDFEERAREISYLDSSEGWNQMKSLQQELRRHQLPSDEYQRVKAIIGEAFDDWKEEKREAASELESMIEEAESREDFQEIRQELKNNSYFSDDYKRLRHLLNERHDEVKEENAEHIESKLDDIVAESDIPDVRSEMRDLDFHKDDYDSLQYKLKEKKTDFMIETIHEIGERNYKYGWKQLNSFSKSYFSSKLPRDLIGKLKDEDEEVREEWAKQATERLQELDNEISGLRSSASIDVDSAYDSLMEFKANLKNEFFPPNVKDRRSQTWEKMWEAINEAQRIKTNEFFTELNKLLQIHYYGDDEPKPGNPRTPHSGYTQLKNAQSDFWSAVKEGRIFKDWIDDFKTRSDNVYQWFEQDYENHKQQDRENNIELVSQIEALLKPTSHEGWDELKKLGYKLQDTHDGRFKTNYIYDLRSVVDEGFLAHVPLRYSFVQELGHLRGIWKLKSIHDKLANFIEKYHKQKGKEDRTWISRKAEGHYDYVHPFMNEWIKEQLEFIEKSKLLKYQLEASLGKTRSLLSMGTYQGRTETLTSLYTGILHSRRGTHMNQAGALLESKLSGDIAGAFEVNGKEMSGISKEILNDPIFEYDAEAIREYVEESINTDYLELLKKAREWIYDFVSDNYKTIFNSLFKSSSFIDKNHKGQTMMTPSSHYQEVKDAVKRTKAQLTSFKKEFSSHLHESLSTVKKDLRFSDRTLPDIIYDSSRHRKSTSGGNVLGNLHDIVHSSPGAEDRKPQQTFTKVCYEGISSGRDVVVEGPTGLGKTKALLASALSHVEGNEDNKAIYVTRTITQVENVLKEINSSLNGSHGSVSTAFYVGKNRVADLENATLNASDEATVSQQMMEQAKNAQIIVAPYIFLNDAYWKQQIFSDNTVIIADEAHNFINEAIGNPFLSIQTSPGSYPDSRVSNSFSLETIAENAKKQLFELRVRGISDEGYHGLSYNRLFTYLDNIDFELKQQGSVINQSPGFVTNIERLLPIIEEFSDKYHAQEKKNYGVDKALSSFKQVVQSLYAIGQNPEDFYEEKEGNEIIVHSYNPAQNMQRLTKGAQSTVYSSATISPVDDIANLIGLNAPITKKIDSLFPDENYAVFHGIGVNTARKNSGGIFLPNQEKHIKEYVQYAVEAARGRNIGLFCSSIPTVYEAYNLIKDLDDVVLLPYVKAGNKYADMKSRLRSEFSSLGATSSKDLDDNAVIKAFKEQAETNKTVILMGVQGGTLSEGVDYRGTEMEMVMLLGIPYPNIGQDPHIEDRIAYFTMKNGGNEERAKELAYKQESFRKLAQSIGRTHRTMTDRAVVLTLDERILGVKQTAENHYDGLSLKNASKNREILQRPVQVLSNIVVPDDLSRSSAQYIKKHLRRAGVTEQDYINYEKMVQGIESFYAQA
jgi:DNA excision repair protein ERCC-2